MKAPLHKLVESELVLKVCAALAVLGLIFIFFYLRNGAEYFSGNSGGAYWDNMNYCKVHRVSQMNIYGELISCKHILNLQGYCKRHLDESLSFGGSTVPCDQFLGVDDNYPP